MTVAASLTLLPAAAPVDGPVQVLSSAAAEKAVPGSSRALETPAEVPAEPVLVEELTTAYSQTYLQPDGSKVLESYTVPVNYRDGAGQWRKIENTLVDDPAAGYAARNEANAFAARIPVDASRTPVRFETDGSWVSLLMDQARPGAPEVAEDHAVFEEVARADRVEYQVTPTGLKENIVLDAPPAAGTTVTYGYAVRASNDLTLREGPEGSLEFVRPDPAAAAGENVDEDTGRDGVVVSIPAGVMLDSADGPAGRRCPRRWTTRSPSRERAPGGCESMSTRAG